MDAPLKTRQRGSGLVEVMVSLLILTVGLLGYASLEGNAIKVTREARQYSEASMLAYDLFDRIRTNRLYGAQKPASYETSLGKELTTKFDCYKEACEPKEIANWDLANWKTQVASLLPGGDAKVSLSTNNISGYTVIKVSVTIRYQTGDNEYESWDFEAVV